MLVGVAPIVLVVLMVVTMPESVRYMVTKGYAAERIRAVLSKISTSATAASSFFLAETKSGGPIKSGIAVVLSSSYRIGSIMLWISYFMGLVIFYALINWMPILFKDAGIDPKVRSVCTSAPVPPALPVPIRCATPPLPLPTVPSAAVPAVSWITMVSCWIFFL